MDWPSGNAERDLAPSDVASSRRETRLQAYDSFPPSHRNPRAPIQLTGNFCGNGARVPGREGNQCEPAPARAEDTTYLKQKQFRRFNMKKTSLWVLPLVLIFGSLPCLAQSVNSGDIRGSVTDPSGALIPGVTVTVLNVNTGVSKSFTSNDSGLYDTNSIVTGSYTLTFKKDGFGTLVRGPVSVEVGFTTVNAELQVGAASQEVTVTSDVPLLKTETSEQSTTLEAKSMAQLPQVAGGPGVSWENFMILLPGATGNSDSSQGSSNPGQEVAINGNLPYSNILADGASTTLSHSQNANPAIFETVAELQVNTSSFSAQYGIGGAIFNQISKGGTSQFHGAAYDYFQNDALTAQPYLFGATAQPIPHLRFNNFGFAIGGPILKKKMFFFFD